MVAARTARTALSDSVAANLHDLLQSVGIDPHSVPCWVTSEGATVVHLELPAQFSHSIRRAVCLRVLDAVRRFGADLGAVSVRLHFPSDVEETVDARP